MSFDIAIVGMACRLPGADSPAALWDNLVQGVDGITPVPASRWDAELLTDEEGLTAGTMSTRMGGFLAAPDAFDADFFGISSLEAEGMDPQQRLLLEVAWHALEDAAIAPSTVAGSDAGVFLGAAPSDYAQLAFRTPATLTSTAPTGAAVCMIANRLSQTLDIRGPSLVFDTGCSSSLVAADRACASLRRGEVSLALVGGVSLMLTPEPSVALSGAWMLSPSGRCRSFDAAADGYVRGEGCGLVVLKRLEDALHDGDRVDAVIRGSAINHGGRGPSTTTPSREGIAEVTRRAVEAAGIHSGDVGYVECHGVASPTADAIEIEALRSALPDAACAIGSVKSSLGHLEWAAGITALIKAALSVGHGVVAPSLHFDSFAPDVDPGQLHVPTRAEPWPRTGPRIAAVNSFGLGGANAHMIVESWAPAADPTDRAAVPARFLLPVSARSEPALSELLARYQQRSPVDYATCRTAALGRNHDPLRAAFVVEPRSEEQTVLALREGLEPADGRPPVAMVFTGQGAQHEGMGIDLLVEPVFDETLARCNEILAPLVGRPLHQMLQDEIIHQTRYAQAGLFALQVSLAALWESWGVRPDLVLGHSVGEIAAAHVSGVLSLEDAARLVAERGRLMGSLPGETGSMLAVFAPQEEVASLLPDDLEIAALNGPAMTVVSGAIEAVDAFAEELEEDFVSHVPLRVSHAFHSRLMEPICDELGHFVRDLRPVPGRTQMVSTLTGEPLDDASHLGPEYWPQQVRRPVRFHEATRHLEDHLVLEIGPGSTLCKFGERCRPDLQWIASIANPGAPAPLIEAAGALYERGADIDWHALFPVAAPAVRIPSYPFATSRHWLDGPAAPAAGASTPAEAAADLRQLVASTLAGILDESPHDTHGFFEAGLDSLGAVELARRLSQSLHRTVPVTMIFAHPTIQALARALAGPVATAAPAARPVSSSAIAVVGWSCRLPGDVSSPDDLWRLLLAGTGTTGPIPPQRLAGLDEATRAAVTGRRGSFLDRIDAFDPAFFGISPREARAMDPQHLLLLELAWEAMEDAGLRADDLRDTETGVFTGLIELESHRATAGPDDAAHSLLGKLASAAAGRISHLFGLRGPSLAVETACSSSLVAIHLACQSLRRGECERAFAGGVNLMMDPSTFLALDAAGALSADGSCKTFDAAADGYGRGEGGALLTLRRHEDALAAGERILALIHGSAVNHDGRAAGFTVPNGRAQEAVIRAALADAGVAPEEVGYHEAHGTGTSLGDPIEIDAIAQVHGGRSDRLVVGSLKTNIGHLEAAAGVAGLLKAALSLDRGRIPPHPHLQRLNPHLDLEAIPATVPTAVTDWPAAKLAGVSSFGMSGTNAHVVIGPAPERSPNERSTRTHYLPVSGHTEREMRDRARQLRGWLAEHPTRLAERLADLCFTESRHRDHGPSRILLAADGGESMLEQLQVFLSDGASIDPQTTEGPLRGWLVDGTAIDWQHLNPSGELVSLPPRIWNRLPLRPEPEAPPAASRTVDTDTWLHETAWEPVDMSPATSPQADGGRWWIAVDVPHDATRLIDRLRDRQIEAFAVPPEGELPDDAAVIVWMRRASWAFGPILDAIGRTGRLVVVTREGVRVDADDDVDPLASAAWGFGRSLANERPGGCRLLDVDRHTPAEALADALCGADPQLAIRADQAFAPRLVPRRPRHISSESGAVALETRSPGQLGELEWRQVVRRAPGSGEVEVRVDLLLLNFGDAVAALGLGDDPLPIGPPAPRALGIEWVGFVEAVGQEVTDLKPGDRVAGLSPQGAASHVTIDRRLACPLPDSMSVEDAAALPVSYVLAWYALMDIAQIRSGQRVLIHSAASTVGLAAVDIAAQVGAEVIATAGNAERRGLLRQRGIAEVYDSRTLDFVERVSESGRVDVILNSIAGAGVDRNLQILRPGGRLVEIGQRGAVPEPAPRNVSVLHADLVDLAVRHPDVYHQLLSRVTAFVGQGEGRSIPLEVLPSHGVSSAIRRLARAVHTGKVALSLDDAALAPVLPSVRARLRPADGTVLVTGGLGGLGRRVVERLVGRGFRHIAVASRRAPDEATQRWIREQAPKGGTLHTLQGDVGRAEDVDRMLSDLRSAMPPLIGVVHAAGILEDGLVESQTVQRFDAVLNGKARGAWHLHEHITEPLEFFVLFSSIASLVGTRGQTPYAAANGFLDGLAARRARRGLPVTCIQWGPWAEVGMAASLDDVESAPVHAMDPDRCLDVMEQLVVGGATTMACVDADWSRFAVDLPSLRSWMPDLEPVSSEADVSTVEGAVAEILRCTGDTLGTERVEASPSQMGMDSILAVQLSDQLQRSLGVPVPAAGILGAESLEAFLDLALRPLDLERQEKGAPEPAAVVSAEPPNPWLLPLQQPEGARIKLLCFPFAGVGASVYRGWTFDGPIEAHGVELPARGALREEALTMEMDDLVARLRQALLPELDGPFAFFGHCMGGLVAFELARALSRDGKTPEHLFISACPPPDRYAVACFDPLTLRYVSDPPPGYDGLQRMQDLAPARFTEVLRFLDFAPARVVIEDADMMRRALPVAQSDFGLCASYAWKEASPLAMPITTFVGREDPFFDMELPGGVRFAIDEWQRQTTGAFDSFERDGDHYYLMEDGAYLRGLVSHRLVGVAEPAVAG